MSYQRLGPKKTRKLARATGLPILRAWSHGGYHYNFVTSGHLHGWYDLKNGEWGIDTGNVFHYDTCSPERPLGGDEPLFPDGVPPLTPVEYRAMEKYQKIAISGNTEESSHLRGGDAL